MTAIKCWNCGSVEIVPDARGTRCAKCGATDNKLPKPGTPALSESTERIGTPLGTYRYRIRVPDGRLIKQVAKAREAKS